jgi:hypothetical protein
MKKHLSALLLLSLICASAANRPGLASSQTEGQSPEPRAIAGANKRVDVDLTALSRTMVYAEVYNILINPESYMGKTIKMKGPYNALYSGKDGRPYHFVVIEDAAACCQQGLEFIWNGEHTYPDDYPKDQAKIEVTGVFDSYDELDSTFYYLAVDNISFLGTK